ncbi:MAG: GIY-YIG nuclease family protein [Candidatus Hodarchaeales archaeon]
MPYWVYMLLVGQPSRGYNRKIYTGYTQHLGKRFTQHTGLNSTKGARLTRKQPIELAFVEKFPNRKQAMKREWDFKHKSPQNQKKFKLELIKAFQDTHRSLLDELNQQFFTYRKYLESLIEIIGKIEKELITEGD